MTPGHQTLRCFLPEATEHSAAPRGDGLHSYRPSAREPAPLWSPSIWTRAAPTPRVWCPDRLSYRLSSTLPQTWVGRFDVLCTGDGVFPRVEATWLSTGDAKLLGPRVDTVSADLPQRDSGGPSGHPRVSGPL